MTITEALGQPRVQNTKRLRLRLIEAGDASAMYAIKSDFEVTRRYGAEAHRTMEQTRKWVADRIADYQKRDSIMWVIELGSDGLAIGSVCYWHFESDFHSAEIGYELNRAYWHKGIMSEALPPIISYGFEQLALHRIEATPLSINDPSKNLLIGLGFEHEGTLRERIFFRGSFYDQLYFGLLRPDWIDKGKNTRLAATEK